MQVWQMAEILESKESRQQLHQEVHSYSSKAYEDQLRVKQENHSEYLMKLIKDIQDTDNVQFEFEQEELIMQVESESNRAT